MSFSNYAEYIFNLAEKVSVGGTLTIPQDVRENALISLRDKTPWRKHLPGGDDVIKWGESYFAHLQATIRGMEPSERGADLEEQAPPAPAPLRTRKANTIRSAEGKKQHARAKGSPDKDGTRVQGES